ncbi:MAG: tRNA (N(6)-L-threonylcarbamoyladenosine(37)-C(2))-methylthiotransferase MtaB [Eubacteriales bacterium]
MEFSIYTLGCKSNQYESQAMAKLLNQRGHKEVPLSEASQAVIINTCSVTALSDKKSRQTIRSLKKKNPKTLLAVCGCYAQLEPEEIAKLEVNLIGGTGDHLSFIQELETLFAQYNPEVRHLPFNDPRLRLGIEQLPSGGLEGRTRALLKIQDGCENYCSYCIIPYARGKIRSLSPVDSALAIHDLIGQGFSEIVLTGIEIASWGKDLPAQESLLDFLAMANDIATGYAETEGKEIYFRLGSLEPRTITQEFCSQVSKMPSVRPHFHLSLQSGSDTVLKRMNRKYNTERFFRSLTFLRTAFDKPALTTDVIVGFPQESPEEFQETLKFLEKCAFSALHVFPYSPRDGTPAAKMEGQITKEVKSQRSAEGIALGKKMQQAYEKQFIGTSLPVLFESQNLQESLWTGLSPQHIQVTVTSQEALQNKTCLVHITAQEDNRLKGQL